MSQELLKSTREHMQKSIESFTKELGNVRTGRANSAILDVIKVEYYGFPTPLSEIATVTVPEPSIIMIKPYEKESLALIVAAINKSNLGMAPNNDGTFKRITVPSLFGTIPKFDLLIAATIIGKDSFSYGLIIITLGSGTVTVAISFKGVGKP